MKSEKAKLNLAACMMALGVLASCGGSQTAETEAGQAELYQVVSKGGDAADYQAFTDAARLQNGDIVVVFYAGDGHVTYPSAEYPKAGRICMVRSTDEGKTWSTPKTVIDDEADNRDPHIAQMSDGTLVLTFFNTLFGDTIARDFGKDTPIHYKQQHRERKSGGVQFLLSTDNGETWETASTRIPTGDTNYACSAPIREMPDKTWMYPIYHQAKDEAYGAVVLSKDKGKTWTSPFTIGAGDGAYLPAETDVVLLKDGSLYAALRGSIPHGDLMHFSLSKDQGQTWSKVESIGFQGHAPHFLRLSDDAIVMTYRAFKDDTDKSSGYTGFRISFDEGKSWQGPYLVDGFWGAYTSTVELKDNTLLMSYYEEGEASAVRVVRVEAPEASEETIPHDQPVPLKRLPI